MPRRAARKKERTKRVFVSDVHMGAGKDQGPKYQGNPFEWLGPDEAENFSDFLDHFSTREDVKELILLGDIMNNWVCPVDLEPPAFDEIIQAKHNQSITQRLRALAGNQEIKVVYVPGNHDMTITKETINNHFPGIVFGGTATNNSVYRTSRLLAEHGNAHAMFTAPDPINDPRSRLPLGYYISRVVATKASKTGSSQRHYWTYIDDFLELLGPQTLAESVFEALLEEAGLPEDAEIKMRGTTGHTYKVKANEIKEKYADLYAQWQTNRGAGIAFKALMAEIGYLGDIADNICKNSGTNIVIFGHNHDNELDKDSWFVDDRIYANCGSWCDPNKPYSFIETEKDKTRGEHIVRLCYWEKGAIKIIKEKKVDI